jgi:hypothetical protein
MVILLFCSIHLKRELIKLYSGELPVSLDLVRPCLLLVGVGLLTVYIIDVPNARHDRVVNRCNENTPISYGLCSA